jgi:pyruvoyl-dependent arginine decarboxylase
MPIELVWGTGSARTELGAFDAALSGANVHNYNLVELSSIVPEGATIERVGALEPGRWTTGDLVAVVLASNTSTTEGERVAAGLGWELGAEGGVFMEATAPSREACEGELADRATAIAEGDAAVPERVDPELAGRARAAFEADRFSTPDEVAPRFDVGDAVVVRNRHPAGHTRAPRYTRRARGVVRRHHGTFAVPDEMAHGGEVAEPVYSVRFEAAELWDGDTDCDVVHVDMWERYLDPADAG